MIRTESRVRARALQLMYAWELQDRVGFAKVAYRTARLCRRGHGVIDEAEAVAAEVVAAADRLDQETAGALENWRLSRVGLMERLILRLGLWELETARVPPKVAINEAVQLAHRFGGTRSSAFVNGVLDRLAHSLGRL